jgi:glycosyltransferase involved in cell wall biosynthesis
MKISVIIPIYNAEKYLEKCINSLLNQTYSDYELILVDDGSKDNSGNICDYYANKYSNIIVVHKENGGSASARNVGICKAKGNYISFVDSDDYVKDNFLERMVELANIYNADLVECSFKIVKNYNDDLIEKDDKCKTIKKMSNNEMLEAFCSKKDYLKSAVLWNKLIKKELFSNLRFIEGKGIDDEYIIHEILYRSKISIVINDELYFYYMSEGSQMRSGYSLKALDSIEAIENQLKFFKDINNKKLYNMLLYRYFSAICINYYLVKSLFENKTDLIIDLNQKRKNWGNALLVKEIPICDKLILILKRFFPAIIYNKKWRNNL